jgi:hypothetical protein
VPREFKLAWGFVHNPSIQPSVVGKDKPRWIDPLNVAVNIQ